MESDRVARIPGTYQTFEEAVWTRRGTWGAVVLGGLVGLALTLILGTIGLASGIVGGAVAAEEHRSKVQDTGRGGTPTVLTSSKPQDGRDTGTPSGRTLTPDEERAAKGAAIGAGVWVVVTAIVAGLFGGWVAGRVAQVFQSDVKLLALLTWAVGVVMFYGLASLGTSGLASGLGAVTSRAPEVDGETGRQAALVAGTALWALVIGHFVGLLVTIGGAVIGMKRRLRLYPAGFVHDRQEGREFPHPPGQMPNPSSP